MVLSLGIFAFIIFLMYSLYFIYIIRGRAEEFERDLLRAFAGWMVQKGPRVKEVIWGMIFLSAVLEGSYFTMVFLAISNEAMLYITAFFAGVEAFHVLITAANFRNFFSGKIKMGRLFNWRMERISAVLFFTHSLLVIVSLIYFH